MNSKNLEQLLNINKFLSTTPPPNIHSVQAYVSTINISDIFSITFDTPYETLPLLASIDSVAEKILHLQYSHLTPATVFSNGDCLLNSISLICIDSLSYISVRVYIEQIPNIFGCFPTDEPKYVLFSHVPSHLIIYYLGNCENFTENMGFLIIGKQEMAIYNFFNSVIDKLQLVIATKSINE